MTTGVMVAVPSVARPEWGLVTSLLGSEKPDNFYLKPVLEKPVDIARNIAGRMMLSLDKLDYQYMLFADNDATWHPGAIMRLVERNLPIVTGCIYQRQAPPIPTLGMYKGRNERGHHYYNMAEPAIKIMERARKEGITSTSPNEQLFDKTDEDLFEIDGCGMHFCLIRRDVLETIPQPWFEKTMTAAGEDYFFCRKAKSWGYDIYVDLSVHTGHMAGRDNTFGIRDWALYAEIAGSMDKVIEWFGPKMIQEE